MKGKFIVLNKRNGGCPICQGTDGDCRQSDDDRNPLYLCRPSRGEIPGFNFIGETNDGVWGKYFFSNREQWLAENQWKWDAKVISQTLPKSEVKSESKSESKSETKSETKSESKLSASDRNELYLDIFSQLSLNDKDKADLIRRGLSEQDIKDGYFRSISQSTRLDKNYPNLPGLNGNKFTTAGDGYLVPIRDISGLFVSFQVRLYTSEGKYRWAKDCHTLEYSELPLQHCINNHDKWVYLTEGTLKPFIGAKRLNTNTIGASGGQFASSPETFTDSVNQLKDKSFCLTPDAGSKANAMVLNQYRKANRLLASFGQTLWVLDYGQGFDKNMPDFDELESIPKNARYIKYPDWDVLAFLDLPDWDDLNSEDPENWKIKSAIRAYLEWKNCKKFTPDIIIDADKCPLGRFEHYKDKSKSVGFPGRGEILALKLHTGQGKTTRINKELCTKYSGSEALLLNHRNSLGDQFVKDVDIFIDKNGGKNGDRFYMLNNINNTHYPRLVLCADSLIKFKDDLSIFDDKIIILDEFESLLRHITGGGTLKGRQKEIMALIEEVFKRAYCVIIADANLTDRSCDFIQKLTGFKLTKVGNKRLPQRPKVYFYDETKGNPKYLIGKAYQEVFPWIMTDSSVDSKSICRDGLKKGKTYLEINADSINDDENPERKKWIRAFLENPNIVDSPDFPYDGIVSSPTIESGISSTSLRFTGVYMFIKHLESLVSSQMIMRSRNIDCPRYISIKDYVQVSDGELRSPFERNLAKNHIEGLKMAMDLYLEGSVDADQYKEILNQIVENQVNDEWVKLSHYHKAITNYERQNLKACALETLQEHGFEIEVITEDELLVEDKSLTYPKSKKEVKIEECEKIFNSDEITPEKYEMLSKRADLTPKEKASMEKHRIINILPGIESDEMWSSGFIYYLKEENPKVLKQAELRVLLGIPELAKIRSEKTWDKIIGGNKFLGNFKDNYLLVKKLNEKNVMGLLTSLSEDQENCYSNDTPALKEFYKNWSKQDTIATKIEKGISPVGLIKRLANRLGFTPKNEGKDHLDQRAYSLADDFLDEKEAKIMTIIEINLCQELSKKQSENASQQSEVRNRSNPYREGDTERTNDLDNIYIPGNINCPVDIQENLEDSGIINQVRNGQENLKEFIKDSLNDFLQDQRCDRLMGKKIKQGIDLLSDAISYCYNRADEIALELIETIARELALANELIGLVPADIAC